MIILITGASSGFGKAMKTKLESLGHTVYGTSRKGTDDLLKLDVRNTENCAAVIDEIISKHGKIDVLINNAGMGLGGAIELTTENDFRLQMDTNFYGVVNMCRAVLPYMRKARAGRIINFSSIAGRFAIPYQGPYSCSKFAIEAYSQTLVLETAQFGISVLCVEPGDFATGFTAARLNSDISANNPDYKESYARVRKGYESDELEHGGTPEYLANKIAKLVTKRHPAFHNVIAPNPIQGLSVWLSRVMPTRLFLNMIAKFYNV